MSIHTDSLSLPSQWQIRVTVPALLLPLTWRSDYYDIIWAQRDRCRIICDDARPTRPAHFTCHLGSEIQQAQAKVAAEQEQQTIASNIVTCVWHWVYHSTVLSVSKSSVKDTTGVQLVLVLIFHPWFPSESLISWCLRYWYHANPAVWYTLLNCSEIVSRRLSLRDCWPHFGLDSPWQNSPTSHAPICCVNYQVSATA